MVGGTVTAPGAEPPGIKKSCPVCDSAAMEPWARASDVEYFSTTDRFDYLACRDCGSLSIRPCPADRLAEIYPPTYYSFQEIRLSLPERIKRWLDRRMFRSILQAFSRPELAVLDIGGGTGWLLDEVRRAEPRVGRTVVIDIDAEAQRRAEAAGHEFILARAEEAGTVGKFDLVMMLNLVEHVQDPVALLTSAGNMLGDDGAILVKTPNVDSWDARLFRTRYWGGLHCPRHWTLFTPESLRLAAEHAGLTVRWLRCTQGAPFWTWSVLHLLHRRGLIAAGYDRPLGSHPLAGPLTALFAAVDFLRLPVARTSQMFALLERQRPDST